MELQQPDHLVIPNRGDPERWERMPVIYERWARWVLPQFGLGEEEVSRFVLGNVIETILYDDGNCFPNGGEGQDWYYRVAEGMQGQLFARLTWEISLGLLPEDVTPKLEELLEFVVNNNWSSYANMESSRDRWRAIKVELEGRICKGGDLEEVYSSFVRTDRLLRDFWVQFMEGK